MKVRIPKCDILFVPYNYLINEEIRERIGLSLKNKIILIDEAHNIASAAQSVYDRELST
jgi:Rad3-related DNA helicase